jgi:putative peptidoglycan lipid II flippase
MIKASLRLSIVSAVIALLSFGCQIFTAHTFGARHQFDVYLFAISIPFLIMGASAGAVSLAFVPRLMAARRDRDLYRSSVTALLGFAILAAIVIAFGGMHLTVWSTATVRNVFNGSDRYTVMSIARVAWFSAGLALIVSALTAVHNTEKSFVLPAITTSSAYLGMIGAMALFSASRGSIVLAWGMLAGSAASVLVLLPRAIPSIAISGFAKSQLYALFDGAGRVILVVIANCAFSGLAPVEAFLAPKFGPGALSYLGYSQRLIIAMGAMVVAGPNVLLVPAIAEACVEKDLQRVKTLSIKAIGAVCVAAALAALIFGVLRVPLIRLVLQHGAFDSTTTLGVASTLPWMLVGSIAMLGSVIAFRALYGQNLHVFPSIAGILVPVLYFGLGSLLSSAIGFQGICVAYASAWWLIFAALLVKLYGLAPRQLRLLVSQPVLGVSAALSVAATTMWAAQKLLLRSGDSLSNVVLGLRCGTVALLGIASFAVVGLYFWPRWNLRKLISYRISRNNNR